MFIMFFLGSGLFLFLGTISLLNSRKIENIPSSCISDLKEGLVEIKGIARKTQVLESPFTKTECVLYKYKVEIDRSGKRGADVNVDSGDSYAVPFLLEDATGTVLVYPQAAALMFPSTYRFQLRAGDVLPDNLRQFLQKLGVQDQLAGKRLDFKEQCIKEGEEIYILGRAGKRGPGVDFVIAKEDPKDTLIISRFSEQELVKRLRGQYTICFCVGIALFVLGLIVGAMN